MPKALIWGASGGIGSAIASQLIEAGWQVFGAGRHEDKIASGLDGIYHFDAQNPETIDQVCYSVAQAAGTVDLIVYAAGAIFAAPLDRITVDDWERMLAVNFSGAHYAISQSLNLVEKGAHLMVISAYVDKITLPRIGAYTAAKAALETLVTIYQKENRRLNFTIVRPPAVDTPFWENAPFKLPDYALQPQAIAEKIIAHYESGASGELNL